MQIAHCDNQKLTLRAVIIDALLKFCHQCLVGRDAGVGRLLNYDMPLSGARAGFGQIHGCFSIELSRNVPERLIMHCLIRITSVYTH